MRSQGSFPSGRDVAFVPRVIPANNGVPARLALPPDYTIEMALTELAGTALEASIPAVWHFAHLSLQVATRAMPTRVATRRNLLSRVARGSPSRKASST